jgi:ATP-dependent helicase HepA
MSGSNDALPKLIFGTQALRRLVERESVELFGALGVAALRLPHQLGNVQRALTAPRVRHLLADEVGLGKTVQALMVLNALHAQTQGRLRALILVPDALVAQWREELITRAHQAPVGRDLAPDEEDGAWRDRRVRLAWPRGGINAAEIHPDRYDLLIVDEVKDLPASIQERIARVAWRFSSLLLLTATPPFHDPERLLALVRALEPAKVITAGGAAPDADAEAVLARLRAREAAEADAADAEGAPPRAWVAAARCGLRGMMRTRRADWPDLTSGRALITRIVEPTEAEVRRVALMWRYLGHVSGLSQELDLERIAQRALRGRDSLRQRVTWLRGHGHEREGLLAEVSALLDRSLGDSRLDALVELLIEIWGADPDARVVVVAGDNLVADSLTKRLPELLGVLGTDERPVVPRAASLRNQSQAPGDIDEPMSESDIALTLERFSRGDVNLLIAAAVGRTGLNLQRARHLILYSVPWDPHDVEQWVGRVDRLGGGDETVRVYAIALRGLVDERVLEVIQRAGVLTEGGALDGALVQRVRDAIRAAALSDDPGALARILPSARAVARGSEVDEATSPLLRDLPWGPAHAQSVFDRLASALPVPPTLLARPGADGFEAREQALLGWLYAAKAVGAYQLRSDGGGVLRLGDPLNPAWRHTAPKPWSVRILTERPWASLLVRRAKLRQPPQREVRDDKGDLHPLRFFDHGSELHDGLVKGWRSEGMADPERPQPTQLALTVPDDHPAAPLRGQLVALWVGCAFVGDLLPAPEGLTPAQRVSRDADERWLADLLPAQLALGAVSLNERPPRPLPLDAALGLLQLQGREGAKPPGCVERRVIAEDVGVQGVEAARRQAEARVAEAWAERRPALEAALAERLFVLKAELEELDEALATGLSGEVRAALEAEREATRARLAWLPLAARRSAAIEAFRGVVVRVG